MSAAHPHVLVVNAGSSSLKYQLIDATSGLTVAVGLVSEIGGASRHRHEAGGQRHEADLDCADHGAAFAAARSALAEHGPMGDDDDLVAVGHRVVHGGRRFASRCVVDDEVGRRRPGRPPRARPGPRPRRHRGDRGAQAAFPGIPHVAVFDTISTAHCRPRRYTYAVRARGATSTRPRGTASGGDAWVSRPRRRCSERTRRRCGRSCSTSATGPVPRLGPLRRRDLDGAVAGRGAGHGYPSGRRRPCAGRLPRPGDRLSAQESTGHWTRESGLLGRWRGCPTPHPGSRGGVMSTRGSPST